MRDILPNGLIDIIRDRYLAGVSDAQEKFYFSKGDEDALTGALGHAISMARPMTYSGEGRSYRFQISYQKIRGRGPGAPEHALGADGIFEIEVFDENGRPLRQKGLPFQSMKTWNKTIGELRRQAHDIIQTAGQGLVVDFSPGKYTACPAATVFDFHSSKAKLKSSGEFRDLGHILADQFLECRIGQFGLHYDPDDEIYRDANQQPFIVNHEIRATVTEVASS
jgi:hypothetical protein